MRYEGLTNIVKLAIRMQGLRGGMTLDEIEAEFGVSRRTAERMRDAVQEAFGVLETGGARRQQEPLAAPVGRAPPPRPPFNRRTGGAGVGGRDTGAHRLRGAGDGVAGVGH